MCGLGVVILRGATDLPAAWLDRIDQRIAHRGRDGDGRLTVRATAPDGTPVVAGFVHRRLSIIDPRDGAQPMVHPAGADEPEVVVVFNGCIYNHRSLRRELEQAGCTFTTDHSDTEVLLHGWRTWGAAVTERLDGMYALAVWDRAAPGELFLARDWFGEKPLFRFERGDLLIAASDARAVADVADYAGAAPDANLDWLPGYLRFGTNVEQQTPWTGVESVALGTPPPLTADQPLGEDDVDDALRAAVAERLEADVPLGCFLSGGIDSSLIAHYAMEIRGELDTFTIVMPDARYDESGHAALVAEHLGTRHHALPVDCDAAVDLVSLIERHGQPFGDSSLLPTHWVARAARDQVSVALSGDGGDELFFGYDRYRAIATLARWRRLFALVPGRFGIRAHPRSLVHRFGRLGGIARDWPHAGLRSIESIFGGAGIAQLCGRLDAPAPTPTGGDCGSALRALDLRGYLPDDLLVKVDLASMVCPLEVRCPFLDRDLVRLAFRASPRNLRRGGPKGLLRAVARRHLPEAIVDRPKAGFAIPIDAWFRDADHPLGRLLRDQLARPEPFGSWPIDVEIARAYLSEQERGIHHGQRLFTLLTLSLFATT